MKWRDARVVEEARLESVYTGQTVSRVRIPIPPHNDKTCLAAGFVIYGTPGKCVYSRVSSFRIPYTFVGRLSENC